MKETGVIMSGSHPKDILEGRKTMTRRVINPQPIFNGTDLSGKPYYIWKGKEYSLWHLTKHCPYGQVGDLLWVRETHFIGGIGVREWVAYRADGGYEDNAINWRPSIFMPRWASRITLEITELRVERVQDIMSWDIEREGCPFSINRKDRALEIYDMEIAQEWFRELWDSLNAKRGYDYYEECWGCKELKDGFYKVRFEPLDDYREIYLWNSEWGITWGWNERDDPEALELDIQQPELIEIVDRQGIHYQYKKLTRQVRTKGIYSWESNPWVWVIGFKLV